MEKITDERMNKLIKLTDVDVTYPIIELTCPEVLAILLELKQLRARERARVENNP